MPETLARNPVFVSETFDAPSGQLSEVVNVPPGEPAVYTVMILP